MNMDGNNVKDIKVISLTMEMALYNLISHQLL